MERAYFLKTDRIGFSRWNSSDGDLARLLWGNPAVTRYICASGAFTPEEISARLELEIANDARFGVQYWPIFSLESGDLIGCCGLRPHGEGEYEIGFHLRPEFWGQGYALEAAGAAMRYAFSELRAEGLFAGHNPKNAASRKLLGKLGFAYTGDEFYAPTGLYHPSYMLRSNSWRETTKIRRMTIEDYTALFALWTQTEGMGLRSLDDSREGVERFLRRNPSSCFVAADGGEIQGAILCGHDGRRGYIYHTVVRKELRGRGVGTALIDAAVQALRAEGVTRVCLNVMESNEAGGRFWENRGWEKKDFLDFYSKSITDRENLPLFKIDP